MRHASAEELVAQYYEYNLSVSEHLDSCAACHSEFNQLSEWLNGVRNAPAPEPDEDFEVRLWSRVRAQLPERSTSRRRWYWGAAAAAASLALFLPRPHSRSVTDETDAAKNQVVQAALRDYLGQAQVLLTEVSHHNSTAAGKARARKLVNDGRLLKAVLRQRGDTRRVSLVNDLEPTLLTVANEPAYADASEWKHLQERVRDSDLVFKVRVVRTHLTEER